MRVEAQAVVLAAGRGAGLASLSNHLEKCNLPLGTLPMLYYPLYFLQEAGFQEATVVLSSKNKSIPTQLVEKYGLSIQIDAAYVDTSDDPGTLESLRAVQSKLKRNVDEFIIVSSDLVTDVKFESIMDQHRATGSCCTVLTGRHCKQATKANPPGPKSKASTFNDIIMKDHISGQLLHYIAGGDYEDDVRLPRWIMEHSHDFEASMFISDAHFYIVKKWVLDYVLNPNLSCAEMMSFKAEVVPHIIGNQFKKCSDVMPGAKDDFDEIIKEYNTSLVDTRFHSLSLHDERICYTFSYEGTCIRANNMNNYWHLNRKIREWFDCVCRGSSWSLRHPSAHIHEIGQVCDDSIIGDGAIICEKVTINSSTVGNHSRVSSGVLLVSSLLADHITIAERCVIENSIIFASINKTCTIKNCIVTSSHDIKENVI